MNIRKLLLTAVVAAALVLLIARRHKTYIEAASLAANIDSYGFIEFGTPGGESAKEILILAAPNCPKEGAMLADHIAQQLSELNIPHRRISSVTFKLSETDPQDLERHNSIMSAAAPLIFINGKVKSNPSLNELLAEYEIVDRL